MLTPGDLKDRLIQSGLCPADKLRGCSDKELMKIEEHIGCRLPQSVVSVLCCALADFAGKRRSWCTSVHTVFPALFGRAIIRRHHPTIVQGCNACDWQRSRRL